MSTHSKNMFFYFSMHLFCSGQGTNNMIVERISKCDYSSGKKEFQDSETRRAHFLPLTNAKYPFVGCNSSGTLCIQVTMSCTDVSQS